MNFDFSPDAWAAYLYWQQTDRHIIKRINTLLQNIARNGHQASGIGKPEALNANLLGLWSRRINEVHRLMHCINHDTCETYQCRGHYGDT